MQNLNAIRAFSNNHCEWRARAYETSVDLGMHDVYDPHGDAAKSAFGELIRTNGSPTSTHSKSRLPLV
jgi:hypothetical protein